MVEAETVLSTSIVKNRKRLFIIMIILIALLVFMLVRVGYWNIIEGERLQNEAITQWISDSVVPAKRGSILDRDMNVLAQSAVSDTVLLLPQRIKDEDADKLALQLAEILEMDYDEVYKKASTKIRKNEDGSETKIGEVWLKRQITTEQSERIQMLQEQMNGIRLITDVKRYYPNKEFAAQVIGYTTIDGDGQTGIERRFNNILEGRQGRMVAETDTHNNDIPNGLEMYIEPVDGQNVVLTLDEVMQSFLETACKQALEEQTVDSVQGMIMDVTTGEIMAMVNVPGFDLNDPPRQDGETLSALSANRITATPFTPGSIFTVFTAAAAIDSQTTASSYSCAGGKTWEGDELLCTGIHGTQSVEQVILNQCEIAAATMATDMEKEPFYNYLENFGFGKKTGIDYTTDTAGEVMGMKYAADPDLAKMGAGESLEVSQLQLVNAAATLVNGGTLRMPLLVMSLTDADGNVVESYTAEEKAQAISADTSTTIRNALKKNVTAGKASEARIPDYTTGVIYGLADVYNDDGSLVKEKKTSMFMEFAPADNPKYIIMMTLNGMDSSAATEVSAAQYVAPVLSEVLKYAYVTPDGGYDGTSTGDAGQGDTVDTIEVPNVVDMGMGTAIDTLEEAGFGHTTNGEGTVIGQEPAAGEKVAPGTVVQLKMDHEIKQQVPQSGDSLDGVETVEVPDFSGMTMNEAMDAAISHGLKFYAQGSGVARKQYPVAGTNVPAGSSVTVTFKLELE